MKIRHLFILAAVVLLFFSGCAKKKKQQAVMILLDAARADRFSCYGYERQTTPEMDKLAANGALFLNFFTQGTDTRSALPCLLYSRYYAPSIFPFHPLVPVQRPVDLFLGIDDESMSFPKALGKAGVHTAGISAHAWLMPETDFAKEFSEFHGLNTFLEADEDAPHPTAAEVLDHAIQWIGSHAEESFFLYIHLMDTHFPHPFGEDARYFYEEDLTESERSKRLEQLKKKKPRMLLKDPRYLNALYDGSLRYTDREIGRLVSFLEESEMLRSTILMITADHGEFLMERDQKIGHSGKWYEIVGRIPLIIHYPERIAPRREDALAEMVDIGPTILKLFGVRQPKGKKSDGIDIMAMTEGKIPEKTHAFIKDGGIRSDRYKCLFNQADTRLLSSDVPASQIGGELYDLSESLEEMENLYQERTNDAENLLQAYRIKMSPLFTRFENAKTTDQPTSPFAIASKHFETKTDVPLIQKTVKPKKLLISETPSGWFRSKRFSSHWFFAKPDAEPVVVSFPVPSGKYYLIADINGACILDIDGNQRVLGSETQVDKLNWTPRQVDFGLIEVKDHIFTLTISPHPGTPWLAVKHLGFIPDVEGELGDMDYQKRLERLKALGYVR